MRPRRPASPPTSAPRAFDGQSINWSAPTLNPGAVAHISYTVTVNAATALGNGVLTNGVTGANCTPAAAGCTTTRPDPGVDRHQGGTPPSGTEGVA